MSDDEDYGPPASEAGGAGGKLIEEDVFLSRLAARQEAASDLEVPSEALSALQEALQSLGITPDSLGAGFLVNMAASPVTGATADTIEAPAVEDLAVETLFLDELQAGKRPLLSDYLQRYPQQRDALLRLVARMDPRELAGLTPPKGQTPEARVAAERGQREGELRALRSLATGAARPKRRRGIVAEERAPYDVPPDQSEPGSKREPPRARPEDAEPER